MRKAIEQHPEIVANAEEAIRRAGVEPVRSIIRGGTDGARLTEKGLPTPNLFTGGQKYHSRREWASVQDMAAAAATCVELVKAWAPARFARRLATNDARSASGRVNAAAEPVVAEAAHLCDEGQQRRALLGQLVLDAGR